jgi:hypothetical protein
MIDKTKKLAVIDFEAAGFSPQHGRVIEVGIAFIEGDQIIDTYQSLMNPGISVSNFIESLTGISQSMVNQARSSSVVMHEACEVIGELPVVAPNASFDRKSFIDGLNRIGRRYIKPFLCTLLIGRRLYPLPPNHKLVTLASLNNINSFTIGQSIVSSITNPRAAIKTHRNNQPLIGAEVATFSLVKNGLSVEIKSGGLRKKDASLLLFVWLRQYWIEQLSHIVVGTAQQIRAILSHGYLRRSGFELIQALA